VSIEAAEANYFEAWRLLAANVATGIVEEDDEILFAAGGGPVAYFNSAFVKPPARPSTCARRAAAFFRDRHLPFVIRFRDEGDPAAAEACEAIGLVGAGESPIMNADVDAMPSLGPGFDVRVVDAGNYDEHVETMATGFGLPAGILRSFFTVDLFGRGPFEAFTAYDPATGQPASTAALILSDGVAGIYNVATPEPFRRRGFGEATTRAAVDAGRRHGCSLATLQASEMGDPIYERMGFRTVARWLTYAGE